MKKKVYLQPSIQISIVQPSVILEGSNTGASGNDVPWGAKQRTSHYDYFEEEEDYDFNKLTW